MLQSVRYCDGSGHLRLTQSENHGRLPSLSATRTPKGLTPRSLACDDAPHEGEYAAARAAEDWKISQADQPHDQVGRLVDHLESAEPSWRFIEDPEVQDAHLVEPERERQHLRDVGRSPRVRIADHLGVEPDHLVAHPPRSAAERVGR